MISVSRTLDQPLRRSIIIVITCPGRLIILGRNHPFCCQHNFQDKGFLLTADAHAPIFIIITRKHSDEISVRLLSLIAIFCRIIVFRLMSKLDSSLILTKFTRSLYLKHIDLTTISNFSMDNFCSFVIVDCCYVAAHR